MVKIVSLATGPTKCRTSVEEVTGRTFESPFFVSGHFNAFLALVLNRAGRTTLATFLAANPLPTLIRVKVLGVGSCLNAPNARASRRR